VLAGRADPRLASWAIWACAMGIACAGASRAGQEASAAVAGAGAVCCGAILLAGWRHGDRGFGRLDAAGTAAGTCGLILLGIALARPDIIPVPAAVAASVLTDLAAFIPTWANGWRGQEPSWPYVKFAVAAAVALAATDLAVAAGVIYPAYELAACTVMVALVLAGRRHEIPGRVVAAAPGAADDQPGHDLGLEPVGGEHAGQDP
jgi:hypothetical protein